LKNKKTSLKEKKIKSFFDELDVLSRGRLPVLEIRSLSVSEVPHGKPF
jgi:hypothetical protein